MNYTLFGTAGHIDHGKSSLIKALSGFWGDESPEEKRRQITIDLSFSCMKNDEKTVAFIDAPGHESLVGTMISGACGYEACLLVVDINEAIMPQTKEHLQILSFLEIPCILVLSKCDLCEDLQTQTKKIVEQIDKINIKILKIFHTNIYDQKSIDELKKYLFAYETQKVLNQGIFRLFVDRVFSLKGIGLVATGTIYSGEVSENQKIYISELAKVANIKTLHMHEQKAQKASQYQRVALNLSDLKASELKKGMQLTQKGFIRGFLQIDVKVHPFGKISHNQEIILQFASKKTHGKILFYNEKYAKLILKEEIFCIFGDKAFLSFDGKVKAGIVVLNPIIDPLDKKTKLNLLENLDQNKSHEAFKILATKHKKGFGLVSSYQRFGFSHEEALNLARQIPECILDEKALNIYPKNSLNEVILIIKKIYTKNPLAMLSETSISQKHQWISLYLAKLAFEKLLLDKTLEKKNGLYISFGLEFSKLENKLENKVFAILHEANFSPEAPYNIYEKLDLDRKSGDNIFKSLCASKKIVRLSHNLFISSKSLSNLVNMMKNIIENEGYIDINNFKNHLNLSRKYLIAYLDYLDNFADIKKVDNRRVLNI